MSSITITDVLTQFGTYYLNNNQNMNRLIKIINWPATTEKLLTPMVTDETVYRAAQSLFTRLVQPFQIGWTPIGALTFEPVAIPLYKQKVDSDSDPSSLEASWLGFLTGPENDPAQWPFIRWFLEVWIIPQVQEDIEINEIWGGVYAAPTPGTAGASGTAMNGLRKQINVAIAAGTISPFADIGAIPTDTDLNVYSYFEMFADRINKKYWDLPMMVACDIGVARRFLRGKRVKYGGQFNDAPSIDMKIADTQLTVVGLPSMIGATKIWCTPKWNVCYFRKKTQNQEQFKMESIKRIISLYCDYWIGVGFQIPQLVWTNNVDLT